MSLYLSKLHFWLFNKIEIAGKLVDYILSYNEENNINPNLRRELDLKFKDLPQGDLESIIDQKNIHGSLEGFIDRVQSRIFYLLENMEMEVLEDLFMDFPSSLDLSPEENQELTYYYSFLNDIFLTGMPCDFYMKILEEDQEQISYRIDRQFYYRYTRDQGLIDSYEYLLSLMMNSFLRGTSVELVLEDQVYSLRRLKPSGLEVLLEEHDNILRMLRLIRRENLKSLESQSIRPEFLRDSIYFIREYADRLHHGKEEDFLFKYMLDELGSIGKNLISHGMLVEHDLARYYLLELEKSLDSYMEDPSNNKILDIISHSMAYSDLLTRHIDKENRLVYSFALKKLEPDSLKAIDEKTWDFQKENAASRKDLLEILEKYEAEE